MVWIPLRTAVAVLPKSACYHCKLFRFHRAMWHGVTLVFSDRLKSSQTSVQRRILGHPISPIMSHDASKSSNDEWVSKPPTTLTRWSQMVSVDPELRSGALHHKEHLIRYMCWFIHCVVWIEETGAFPSVLFGKDEVCYLDILRCLHRRRSSRYSFVEIKCSAMKQFIV